MTQLIRGPLHWWGISDLVLSNSGQLLAFRLTPLAGLLLHGSQLTPLLTPSVSRDGRDASLPPSVPPPWGGAFITSEAGDILIACTSAAWPLIELLEDFAEVAGVQAGRLRYRLTVKSLGEALSRGLHPASLLQLLHEYAEPSLTPLLVQLERRVKNYGRVRFYTDVTLLEVADTAVIRELSVTTPLEEQVVQTIHPTLLILKKQGAERIMQDLKRRGQVPLLHEEDDYGAE